MIAICNVLFLLIAAHYLCDYALQSDAMAKEKSRWSTSELQKHVPWYHWLTGHSLIHGMAVMLILSNVYLALAETAVHWITDYLKCSKRIGIVADQAIHISAKVLWVAIFSWL